MGGALLRLLAVFAIALDVRFGTAAVADGNIVVAVLFGIGLAGGLWLRHLAGRHR
jgi:hypothetical protein